MFMPQLSVLAVFPLPESSVIVVLPETSESKLYSAQGRSVGVGIGDVVGASDGSEVGAAVGVEVGAAVGCDVGISVGMGVGCGVTVGADVVGCEVGASCKQSSHPAYVQMRSEYHVMLVVGDTETPSGPALPVY